MSHKLYDIALYYEPMDEQSTIFARRQNAISALYVYNLNGYKPQSTSRISVTLADKDLIIGYMSSSVLSVYAHFDKFAYWQKSAEEQNLIIIDTIHRIALASAEKYNWNKEILEQAYQKTLAANFKYAEGKIKISKDKKTQSLYPARNGSRFLCYFR
ncbi:hypothetical protein [Hymenobacter elongatus]|uniref:Uncharacterized protein n=1 Tax=Hymenobacter elongatus TaxID=877208 RepID=A0A4Z0PRL4_9BACT|nr:hypothetical protein [Hymenobacter elongatus]TGE20165.1 hypothetical protein E5J99_00935 [Hymenobacter elongatus]